MSSSEFSASRPRFGRTLDAYGSTANMRIRRILFLSIFLTCVWKCSKGVEYLLRRSVQFHAPLSCRDLAARNRGMYPLPT